YDHFLALFWEDYIMISLEEYIKSVHSRLAAYYHTFPDDVKEFFPKFVKNNWIRSYASIDGIEKVLFGMSRCTSLPQKTEKAMEILSVNYERIGEEFNIFFPEIINYVESEHDITFDKPFRPLTSSSYAIPA
ncbi:MAG: ACP phosphodiesterase, partial [Bacteroidota bacterium]